MEVKKGYDYNSVYLIPKSSQINSRGDVDLHSPFHGLYPIISSPMKGISSFELISEMSRLNCIGIYHRFDSYVQRLETIERLEGKNFGVAIGLRDHLQELIIANYAVKHGAKIILLDLANGYLQKAKEFVKSLNNKFGNNCLIMSGNVVTTEGAQELFDAGSKMVRVGIGSGVACTTRDVTGIGYPQLSAIEECSKVKELWVVADGGISSPGNGVKAFATGASFLMLGGALANTFEAGNDGSFNGMSSKEHMKEVGIEIKSNEGREVQLDINKRRPLEEIINEFLWGIRSACTYLNCKSYLDIKDQVQFIETGKY